MNPSASQSETSEARVYHDFWAFQHDNRERANAREIDAHNRAHGCRPVQVSNGIDFGIPYAVGEDRIPGN
jgi:hypothetical protein